MSGAVAGVLLARSQLKYELPQIKSNADFEKYFKASGIVHNFVSGTMSVFWESVMQTPAYLIRAPDNFPRLFCVAEGCPASGCSCLTNPSGVGMAPTHYHSCPWFPNGLVTKERIAAALAHLQAYYLTAVVGATSENWLTMAINNHQLDRGIFTGELYFIKPENCAARGLMGLKIANHHISFVLCNIEGCLDKGTVPIHGEYFCVQHSTAPTVDILVPHQRLLYPAIFKIFANVMRDEETGLSPTLNPADHGQWFQFLRRIVAINYVKEDLSKLTHNISGHACRLSFDLVTSQTLVFNRPVVNNFQIYEPIHICLYPHCLNGIVVKRKSVPLDPATPLRTSYCAAHQSFSNMLTRADLL